MSKTNKHKRYYEKEGEEEDNVVKTESNDTRQVKRYKRNDNYQRNNNRSHEIDNYKSKPSTNQIFNDLVNYYSKILQTFKEASANHDTDSFATNVLSESQGYEVRLSTQKSISQSIELLLSASKDPGICRQFMSAFAEKKEEVCTDPNASHITELLLRVSVRNLQDWSTALESEDDCKEKENIIFIITWLTDFGEFVVENLESCLQDQYASHVACSIIRALGGDMSKDSDFTSKKSVNHKKDFREQYMGEQTAKVIPQITPVVLENVPKFFTKLLKKLTKALLNIENIIDYVTESSSAAFIQTLLCILKKRIPKRCKKLITSLAASVFSVKNDDGIPHAFLHRNCSFLVEKMFLNADDELQHNLWNEYFSDCLEQLIVHPVGNFVIQRMFDVIESKPCFEVMSERIGSLFESILNSRYYGIFISVVNACNRLKVQQAQFMKNIMLCLHCLEPEDRQLQLVSLVMGLQLFGQQNNSICLQGSLLVQAMLKFHKPIKVVNSILNMKPQELSYLACHIQGCHILNAFFSSNTVGDKSKDKLIQCMKPNIPSLTCDRNGSLTLSRIWVLLSIKQKSAMAQILAKEEKTLQSNKNGSILLKKFGIFHFVHKPDQWKEIQNNLSQTSKKRT